MEISLEESLGYSSPLSIAGYISTGLHSVEWAVTNLLWYTEYSWLLAPNLVPPSVLIIEMLDSAPMVYSKSHKIHNSPIWPDWFCPFPVFRVHLLPHRN